MTPEQQEQIAGMVRAGYMTAAEIVDAIAETNEEESLDTTALAAMVQAKIEERRRQLAEGGPLAYERLRSAFEQLDGGGVLAREHYWCCQNCAYAAIDEEIWERGENGETVRGYVFFHSQDTDRAVETGQLLLRYGGVTKDPEREGEAASTKIGEEIVALLRTVAFEPRWSGSPDDVIALPIEWDKPPAADGAESASGTPHLHQ